MFEWAGQRVVLTGGAGFLGRNVERLLRARGVASEDVVIPRSRDFDLTTPQGCRALFEGPGRGATVVLHSAGYVGGLGRNRKHPGRMYHDNVAMAVHLVEAARASGLVERGGRFVHVGSMTSYPAQAPLPFREGSLFAGLPDAEIAPYGMSKLAGLMMLRAYRAEYGLRSACAVMVNLYGPGDNLDDPDVSHACGALIKRFCDAALDGAPEVVCWGTGTPTRDFLYIDDAAEGLLRVAEHVDDASAINLASGRETSLKELAGLIASATGYRGRVAWDPAKGDGVARRCLDIEQARTRCGFEPRVGLEEGLRRTIAWYRGRGGAGGGAGGGAVGGAGEGGLG